MALKVASPTPQPKLTVSNNNGGFQGATYNPQQPAPYNPQQTAPSTVLQNPSYNPQPATYNPQPALTAQQVAVASAAIQKAAIEEAARQKEVRRQQVQGALDLKVADSKSAIKLQINNSAWKGKLSWAKTFKYPKIVLPEQTDYDKAYNEAYRQALADYEKQKQGGKKNFLQKTWDKVSFGQDRRDSGAREYASKQAQKIAGQSITDYEKRLNGFLKDQATRKAKIESAKFGSQTEFSAAVEDYTKWEDAHINSLEHDRASITAQLDAYGNASQAKLTSASAKGAGWFNDKVVHGLPGKALGGVWNYTLGQGSKNVPSLVTSPSRLVNWLGNLNTKDRTIYQSGGTSINRSDSKLNAWQAGFNQRNFNIRPWTDKTYDPTEAEKRFGKQAQQSALDWQKMDGKKIGWTGTTGGGKPVDPKLKTKEYWLHSYWDDYNRQHRFNNSLAETAADPLNLLVGAGEVAKGAGITDKIAEAGRASKATGWLFKGVDTAVEAKNAAKARLAETKLVSWLGSEAKTPEQRLQEAIDAAKNAQGVAQKGILPRIRAINAKLSGKSQLDVSVFDDFSNLTDSEAKTLQRMVNGKLTSRDRLILAGKGNEPVRQKLEAIATKWQDFSEQMRQADKVNTTRFGLGKRTYSPRTAWIERNGKTLDEYNFRLKKKFLRPQNSAEFKQGAIDRYFKSSLDSKFAGQQTVKRARLSAERKALLERYDNAVNPARAEVESAYNATRSPLNRVRKVIGTPTRLWKKSVLKYRPAWTVNNVLYNTQAGVLAGGGGSLIEQAKMLNPRYWRKAFDEIPSEVKTNLAKEMGSSGKLNKFYSGVENWSRVAAFRAAKAKGLTDEEALGRVNKYLFDYSTKNWERLPKSIVPFWAWQKNLAKAATTMPFDRPVAAIGYNRLDRYQQNQYDKEFESVAADLKKLGYSDQEIEKVKQDNSKYFQGRLKVGNKWITTPFNAFSEKGLSSLGFNPYLAAAGETSRSVDQYNNPVAGKKAGLWQRLISKFPQADLVNQKMSKPSRTAWIGKPGSEGYGLTKEKQGFDPSKPSYSSTLDPQKKLGQNALAFLGVPRSMEFDKAGLVKEKKLQKITSEYFSKDWKNMPYDQQEKEQKALFDKYGMSADDFYKGILAKYDTESTKHIKSEKEAAGKANKSLFDEYAAQPQGTRNLWATHKLAELVKQGYFDNNPFLKSFKWINPTTVAKADKQGIVSEAVRTGDWSKYTAKYGKTEKSKARDKAVASGDWAAYRAKYGTKATPHTYNGKYFKTAESRQKYIDGEFWRKYADASKTDRRQLLKDNPQYNKRSNWTAAQWNQWKDQQIAKAKLNPTVAKYFASNKAIDQQIAARFLSKPKRGGKKVIWRLQT